MEEELDSVQEKLNTSIIKVSFACNCWTFILFVFPMITKQWYFIMVVEFLSGHQMHTNLQFWGKLQNAFNLKLNDPIIQTHHLPSLTKPKRTLMNPSEAARSLKPVQPRTKSDWRIKKPPSRKPNLLQKKLIKSKCDAWIYFFCQSLAYPFANLPVQSEVTC